MLRELMNQNLFLYAMLAAGITGVWCLFWTSRFYNCAIRDFMRLPEPKSKWMKSVLEQLGERKKKLSDPEAFIHARLIEGKTAGLYLYRIRHVYGYMIGVCLFCLPVVAYTANRTGADPAVVYRHLAVGGAVVAGLLFLRQIFALSMKEETVVQGWLDYLENQYEFQSEEACKTPVKEPVQAAALSAEDEERIARVEEGIRQTAAAESKFSHLLTPEEEDVMREVIREYLT